MNNYVVYLYEALITKRSLFMLFHRLELQLFVRRSSDTAIVKERNLLRWVIKWVANPQDARP